MDWFEYYTTIAVCIKGIVYWMERLPTWGMVSLLLILASLSARIGTLATVGGTIIVWHIFGANGGWLFLAAGVFSWIAAGFLLLSGIDGD